MLLWWCIRLAFLASPWKLLLMKLYIPQVKYMHPCTHVAISTIPVFRLKKKETVAYINTFPFSTCCDALFVRYWVIVLLPWIHLFHLVPGAQTYHSSYRPWRSSIRVMGREERRCDAQKALYIAVIWLIMRTVSCHDNHQSCLYIIGEGV